MLQVAERTFLAETSALRKKVHSSYQRAIANSLTGMKIMHMLEDNSTGGGWGGVGWGRVGGGGWRRAGAGVGVRTEGPGLLIASAYGHHMQRRSGMCPAGEQQQQQQQHSLPSHAPDIMLAASLHLPGPHVSPELSSCATAGYAIDITIPSMRLAVEADGPTHMARNDPRRMLGATVMKRRHLRLLGWQVVNISFKQWAQLQSQSAKAAFLQKAIDAAVQAQVQQPQPAAAQTEP